MPLWRTLLIAILCTLVAGILIPLQAQIFSVDKTGLPERVVVNEKLVIPAEGPVTYDGAPVTDLFRTLNGLNLLPALAYVAAPWREVFSVGTGGPIMATAQATLDGAVEDCIRKLTLRVSNPNYTIAMRMDAANTLTDVLKLDYTPPRERRPAFTKVKADARALVRSFPSDSKVKSQLKAEEVDSDQQRRAEKAKYDESDRNYRKTRFQGLLSDLNSDLTIRFNAARDLVGDDYRGYLDEATKKKVAELLMPELVSALDDRYRAERAIRDLMSLGQAATPALPALQRVAAQHKEKSTRKLANAAIDSIRASTPSSGQ